MACRNQPIHVASGLEPVMVNSLTSSRFLERDLLGEGAGACAQEVRHSAIVTVDGFLDIRNHDDEDARSFKPYLPRAPPFMTKTTAHQTAARGPTPSL